MIGIMLAGKESIYKEHGSGMRIRKGSLTGKGYSEEA
jgi:hypothetical protein